MATIVGLVRLELYVAQANSLKDKRRILKSFKDRTTSRHNVSIAEVGRQDSLRRSVLALAMVGSSRRYVEGALQKIVNTAETHRDMVLVEHEIVWL